jgi:hypothetical protein
MRDRVVQRVDELTARGLTLKSLAARGGEPLTYQVIQQIYSGESQGTKYIVPLARALGCTAEWLWDGAGPHGPLPPETMDIIERIMTASDKERRKIAILLDIEPISPSKDVDKTRRVSNRSLAS